MNRERRKALHEIIRELEDLKTRVEDLSAEELEYYENMPESIQMGDKGCRAGEVVDALDNVVGGFDEAIGYLEDAVE